MKKILSKDKSIEKLQTQVAQIPELLKLQRKDTKCKKWIRDTQVAIEYIFGEKSRHIEDFNKIRYSLGVVSSSTTDADFQKANEAGLNHAKVILESMIEEIREYWDADVKHDPTEDFSKKEMKHASTNKVFIVHGHDTGAKESIARFLTKIDLEPIILHEQPNQGNTIIEKFEEYADVPFAIALLTPDDIGSPVSETEIQKPRARQNVIFEFGYFIGRVGRNRVAGLLSPDVEIPSDYSGVVYIPIDEGGAWKLLLVKELKAAGFDIDANKAL